MPPQSSPLIKEQGGLGSRPRRTPLETEDSSKARITIGTSPIKNRALRRAQMSMAIIVSSVDGEGPQEGPIIGEVLASPMAQDRRACWGTLVESPKRRPLACGVEELSLGRRTWWGLPSNVRGAHGGPEYIVILAEGIVRNTIKIWTILYLCCCIVYCGNVKATKGRHVF